MLLAIGFGGYILKGCKNEIGERNVILIISSLQGILVFMLPSYLVARMVSATPSKVLGLTKSPSWRNVIGILIMYIIALPALNQIILWNDSLHLPSQFSGLEATLRGLENSARGTAETILQTNSIMGLLSGVMVVGCITGLGEEMFFRAGLQRILSEKLSRHVAVWLAAVIFSLLHLQFFGFIPRVLLGATFGYIYLWSCSLWTAAIAHAINNSVVVIEAWLSASGYSIYSIENMGVSESGFPWIAIISAVMTIFFFLCFRRFFFYPKRDLREKSR